MAKNRKRHMNCTHSRTFGYRSRQCPRCKILLRPTDFSGEFCNWCQWELDEPARRIAAQTSPITRPPAWVPRVTR